MSKILVTGGAGFIGSHVVQELLNNSYSVRVLDNLSTGRIDNLHSDAEFINGDIRDLDTVSKSLIGVDSIVHLAAAIGNVKSIKNPINDCCNNTIGTVNLLEAAKDKISHFIYSSSAAIFGELISNEVDEDHPKDPDSPYGVSKLAAEHYVRCFGKLYNINTVCLRYFNVYGERQVLDSQYGNAIPIFMDAIVNNNAISVYGDGEQTRDFVYVKDIAKVNVMSLALTSSNYFNIGSGKAISINNLIRTIFNLTGKMVPVESKLPRPGEVRHCLANNSKVRKCMDIKFTQLEEGLQNYYEFLI